MRAGAYHYLTKPFELDDIAALIGTAIGYLILANDPDLEAWRWMYATAIIPAVLVLLGRFFITESPHWLAIRGRERDAETEILRLLSRTPPYLAPDRLGACP